MLRAMTVDVTVKTIEPTPTAVVVAATTWAEFPKMWGPMLDKVWGFLRGGAPITRCASGARRTGTGWLAPAGRSMAIPTRRLATSMWTCSGRWWRRNPETSGELSAVVPLTRRSPGV